MCAARESRNGGVITGSLWQEESDAKQFADWGLGGDLVGVGV